MNTVVMPSSSATRQACWPPAPPKQLQREAGGVVALLHRDLLDGVGHVGDGDAQEPFGHVARIAARRRWRRRSARPGRRIARCTMSRVQRRVAVRAEDRGEMRGWILPTQTLASVTVERAAAPVAGAGRDRRRRDSGPTRKRAPSKCSIEPPPAATVLIAIIGARMRTPATSVSNARSKRAGVERDIGGGAAHVEADDAVEPAMCGGAGGADDAAGRAGQDGVLALEAAAPRPARRWTA